MTCIFDPCRMFLYPLNTGLHRFLAVTMRTLPLVLYLSLALIRNFYSEGITHFFQVYFNSSKELKC